MKSEKRDKMNECYYCIYSRPIPGDTHLSCTNPDINMMGNKYGITQGWFSYPYNFDPVWKERLCDNFKDKRGQ